MQSIIDKTNAKCNKTADLNQNSYELIPRNSPSKSHGKSWKEHRTSFCQHGTYPQNRLYTRLEQACTHRRVANSTSTLPQRRAAVRLATLSYASERSEFAAASRSVVLFRHPSASHSRKHSQLSPDALASLACSSVCSFQCLRSPQKTPRFELSILQILN